MIKNINWNTTQLTVRWGMLHYNSQNSVLNDDLEISTYYDLGCLTHKTKVTQSCILKQQKYVITVAIKIIKRVALHN